ncbi:SusC/RagA family TonB-linked outer membrane protein [Pedobacter sp. KBW01]|uniref:SusC/RagA family TonB-linked outer membrane protein n=1 Tax=Pedobacter sp. KBW01 TaxID=2153364 RepID=UPI00131A2FEF|nr:SusC/RagA family TonB-linked outer membrane protein [Pedobacter sp. KBW01]
MKLITVLLIATIMQTSASTLAQTITYKQNNVSLEVFFKEIRQQTGYSVFWSSDAIKSRKLDVDFKNAPLTDVMEKCLQGQGLTYTIADQTIVIREKEKSFLDQLITRIRAIEVSGRVLDESGHPLVGATVSVLKVEGTPPPLDGKTVTDFSLIYKGRNAAALTDSNGSFLLKNVDENSVIIISYTGYKLYQVKAAKNLGNIKMVMEAGSLQEVNVMVNTGYLSIARERSAGSIAKPDMQVLKNRSGSMNIIQRLDGLVPGLTINNAPNSTGSSILVRGLTSINGSKNPLYVVNGIPVDDISSVNPNDVEDITVLKDATAASIWGARAANGVIVILTKKGKNSEKIKLDYDAFINFQGKPDLNYLPVLTSGQFIQAAREIFDPVINTWATVSRANSGNAVIAPHELIMYNQSRGIITKEQADMQLGALADYNNLREIKNLWYRNASLMNHTFSLSGGGNKYSFYGSAAYTDTRNNTPYNRNENYGLNLRQDYKFSDRLQLYLITDLRNNITSSKQPNSARPDARFLPYVPFTNTDGTNASMPWLYRTDELRNTYENQSLVSLNYNPLDDLDYGNNKGNLLYGRLTSGLTMKLLSGLRYEGVFGISKTLDKTSTLLDEKSFAVRNELVAFTVAPKTAGALPSYYLPSSGGKHTVNNNQQQNWTLRNQLVYDREWLNGKHQLTLLAGQEAQELFSNTNASVVRGYNSQLLSYGAIDYNLLSKLTTLNNGAPAAGSGVVYYGVPVFPNSSSYSILPPDQYSESELTTRFTSYYANGGYTYNKKYTVNGSWRLDKSNLFGKDKSAQSKPVWSAGVSWAVGKESFMENIGWLDKLVLRTTYGLAGNSPDPGSAASFDVLSKISSLFFQNTNGVAISTPGNKKLSWETTKTTNLGIDFAVLKNRINGSIDLYNKNTENLIGFTPVNPFTGYANITGNLGSMNNKGVELSLTTLNIQQEDFSWTTLFNFAYNKNKITKLNTLKTLNGISSPLSLADDFISQPYLEGYSAFSIFAYQFAGLDKLGDPQIRLKDGTVTKTPGSAKIEDLKYMGTYQPVWSGGFSNVFQYKSVSLSLNTIYNLGNVMRRDVNTVYTNTRLVPGVGSLTSGNINSEFADRWKNPGDELLTNIPSYVNAGATSTGRRNVSYYTVSDINVLDASYIKLRDVTLAFSLPKSLLFRLKVAELTFRAQVSNIVLWTANKSGIDPEFQNALGGQVAGGARTMPFNQHTMTLGAHLTL